MLLRSYIVSFRHFSYFCNFVCVCSLFSRVILFIIYLWQLRDFPSYHLHWISNDRREGISTACCQSHLCYTSYISTRQDKRQALQFLLSLLVCNRIFMPCRYTTGSSFPACVHRVFFFCWCFTGSSFRAGASQISYFKILPWQPNKKTTKQS